MSRNEKLAELREQIAEVDRSLLELLHRRMELASEVGRLKASAGEPIFVPEVHDRVLRRARRQAEACGVSEEVMESIYAAVMRGAIERQHRVSAELITAVGNRMLLIGGAGNMGGWFQGFSRRLGHRVDIIDPANKPLPPADGRYSSLDQIEDLDVYEAILVSVPLNVVPHVLGDIIKRRPRALVIEIASIKDHLRDVLDEAAKEGVRVTSLHPMFGPGKSLYETLTFVVACREDPKEETVRIEEWLRYPNTNLVTVPWEHHDRLMGWLLGLGHLSGMVFGLALTHSGLSPEELQACASTTYNRQMSTAQSVLQEDPDLYYDIQRLNPHKGQVYRAAQEALEALVESVLQEQPQDFRSVLNQAHRFVARSGVNDD